VIGLLYRVADAVRRRRLGDDHGRIGEDLAHRYLRKRGCTIVARRYRPPAGGGEIDLVAWHGGKLVFVEVKTRATAEFGAPERAVDEAKQQALARTGRDYARRAGIEWENVRFDIVSIVLSRPPAIEWLQDAFRPQVERWAVRARHL
jgi:putative endonuclease